MRSWICVAIGRRVPDPVLTITERAQSETNSMKNAIVQANWHKFVDGRPAVEGSLAFSADAQEEKCYLIRQRVSKLNPCSI